MATAAARRKADIRVYSLVEGRKYKSNAYLTKEAKIDSPHLGRIEKEFPRKILIKNTCTISKDGQKVRIGYIKGAPTTNIEEQVKRGFKPSTGERDEIWMLNGSLVVNADQDKILAEYISEMTMNEDSPYLEDKARAWFKLTNVDEDSRTRMASKYAVSKATILIEEMTLDQAKDMLRLAGRAFDTEISEYAAKDMLSMYADADPEFIINGVNNSEQRKVIQIRKALEKNIITFARVNACVAWVEKGDKVTDIVKIGDLGGVEGKIGRFSDYLDTEEGRPVFERMKQLLDEGVEYPKQADPPEEDDKDEDENDGAFVAAPVKKRRGRPRTKNKNK